MQIFMQVSMCGEASLKQGGNMRLGLSCFGRQAGSGVWSMAEHGRAGDSWSPQELMGDAAKSHSGAKNHQTCWCPQFGVDI